MSRIIAAGTCSVMSCGFFARQITERLKMKRMIKKILLFSLLAGLLVQCQHSRVRIAPPTPEDCQGPIINEEKCNAAKNAQKQKQNGKKGEIILEQKFFAWGLYPAKIEYDAAKLCPQGIYEVYQYTTVVDGLLSEITLGFYLPRTLRVTCY